MTAALMTGTFLASIEVTVVAAAMPSIVGQLGSLSLYPWVFSSYLLTQTLSIPLYGRLADLYGRRTTYVFGVSLFLLGSALCGLAPNMVFLVAARSLQGLGAGAVIPLTMTIFGDLFEVAQRTRLQGLFSVVWGVSSIAGPLTGGLIVQHMSWRWVFFLNIPFGLASATLVGVLLREAGFRRSHRLDLRGALALSAATFMLLFGILPAEQRPFALPLPYWLLLSAAAAVIFILLEKGHPEPLLPLSLFRDRVHVAANGTGVLLGVVLFGMVGYLPLYIQEVQGGSPVSAGAILIPLSLGWTTASVVGGRIVWQVGFRFLVRLGCSLIALGIVVGYAGIELQSLGLGIAGEILYGFGMGFSISSFTVSVQESVRSNQRGIATALTQFSRSIGGAVGIAALGSVLGRGSVHGSLQEGSLGQLQKGLDTIFLIIVVVAGIAGLMGILLFPKSVRRGEESSGSANADSPE